MPVEILPHWTFPANWRQPVTERLEWRTAVLASVTASEQAFATRMSPRRTFEVLTTPVGTQRTRFDLAVGTIGVDPWYIPIWHDGVRLDAPLAGGVTEIPVVTVGREFIVGGFVMLTDHGGRSEVVEIASVATGSITLADPTALAWPANTAVYPAVKARLTEQPEMGRQGNRVFEGFVRFITTDANDYTPATGLTTYLDVPVLTVPPNEAVDMTHAYERIFDEIDGDVGLVARSHTSNTGITIQGYNWTALGRAEHADLRALLYYMEGRNNPAWLPTFAEDFDVVSASTGLVVRECGFTTFGGPREGRQDVQIVLRDGTTLFRRIASSTLNLNGTENLVFTSALSGVTAADIERVSFMSLCRLNTDSIEIVHITDSDGVAQVSAQFRSAPATRAALDYAPVYLGDTVANDELCGVQNCIPTLAAIAGSDVVVSAAVAGHRRTNITILERRAFDYVAYVTTESNAVRFGTTRSNSAVDRFAFSPPPAVLASVANGTLMGSDNFVPSPRLALANGTTVFEFNADGSPAGSYSVAGHPIVDFWQVFGTAYGSVSFDGTTIRAGIFDIGGGSSVPDATVATGTFDEVWAKPSGGFQSSVVVARDSISKRLSAFVVNFFNLVPPFSPTISPSGFISDGSANRERLVSSRFSRSLFVHVWREHSEPTGPAGAVKVRMIGSLLDRTEALFNITPLTAPGYGHLGDREPVAAFVLNNGSSIAVVERRYEAVSGQLRAYEVLAVYEPFEQVRQTAAIRLTTPGVGPVGDVRRSADVKALTDTDGGEILVCFENPIDNSGTTQLLCRTFSFNSCVSNPGLDDE